MADIVLSLQMALEIAKQLRTLNEKVKDAEIKMLLSDLQNELADAKVEAAWLKEQIAALTQRNTELASKLESRSREEPEMMAGGYKFGGEGPYCARCYEMSGKKIRLPRSVGIHAHFGQWTCPVCQNHS